MKEDLTEQKIQKNGKFLLYITIEIIILIISIIIPLVLVRNNQTGSCLHHIEDSEGSPWIIGRALGFTTFIWFIISIIFGLRTKKLARAFKSYKKARDLHCFNATITIIVFLVHISTLLSSDPWGDLIFDGEYNHIPLPLFIAKISTGVITGVIMFLISLSSFYFRDMKKMKRFGFKNFIRLHYIMLASSILLAIHIFLINTELLVIFWG
jgi:hypothetical protein